MDPVKQIPRPAQFMSSNWQYVIVMQIAEFELLIWRFFDMAFPTSSYSFFFVGYTLFTYTWCFAYWWDCADYCTGKSAREVENATGSSCRATLLQERQTSCMQLFILSMFAYLFLFEVHLGKIISACLVNVTQIRTSLQMLTLERETEKVRVFLIRFFIADFSVTLDWE